MAENIFIEVLALLSTKSRVPVFRTRLSEKRYLSRK